MLSATKLIRLAQTYSEEQGRDQARINDALEERVASLEQQMDVLSDAENDSGALRPHFSGGGGCADRSGGRSPGVPASPGLCGINTAGLSEWMTGIDKQLEGLQRLVSASAVAGGGSGNSGIGADSKQRAAKEPAMVVDAEAVAQKAAQDECARMEERLRHLEAVLKASVENGGVPSSSLDTKDSAIRTTERECGPGSSVNQAPTQPASPKLPLPPPPPHAGVPVTSDVCKGPGPNNDAVLDAVQEGTAVARKASELAEEALKVGREAAEQSERTGEQLVRFVLRS